MVDFGKGFGLFFVIKLANRFGRVLESGVIDVDDNLRDDGGDFAINAFFDEGIVDGLSEPITDLALAHSYGGLEWHGWSFA